MRVRLSRGLATTVPIAKFRQKLRYFRKLWRSSRGRSIESVKNSDTDPADEVSAIAGGGAAWDDRRLSDNLNGVIAEGADEDRQGRRPALRRRLAGQFIPQGHHRRGHCRLVGIYGGVRRARADRGHLEARR